MATTVQRAPVAGLLNCTGDKFTIDVLDAIGTIPEDTLDAQREQLRDWIWTVTLGRIAQRLGVDEVLASVADEPLRRDSALEHALYMQLGPTRSTATKSGEAIILVENADERQMAAQVLEAIDQETLHLGHTPKAAQVYQYFFRTELARAEVCAMRTIDQAEIESEANGYRVAAIKEVPQLGTFLSGGVDLLSARCTDKGLEVSGRQRPRNANLAFTVHHVAALMQPMGIAYVPPERFGYSLEQLPAVRKSKLEDFATEIDAISKPDPRFPPSVQTILKWKKENPDVATQNLALSFSLQEGFKDTIGFSLDPVASPRVEKGYTNALMAALPIADATVKVLANWGEDTSAALIREVAQSSPEPWTLLQAVRDELEGKPDDRLFGKTSPQTPSPIPNCTIMGGRLVCAPMNVMSPQFKLPEYQSPWRSPPDPRVPTELVQAITEKFKRIIWEHSAQQCARYDGPLAGTAAGMTFFYTDLLAKLWTIDWNGVAPDRDIEGFESLVHHADSTAACQEEAPPSSTRLWFGLRDEGYARELPNRLRFSPIATRIFAKGSHTKAGEAEVEPNAQSRRFIQWWDRHFARIAAWEPQYEVLNQLMKWSVVVQSARIDESSSCLKFLRGVPVGSGWRFDRWVETTKDLRWRGPLNLVSMPEKVTECIPLLKSKLFSSCGDEGHYLIGGVTAATVDEVRAKPQRNQKLPDHLGRMGAGVEPAIAASGATHFEAKSGSAGRFGAIKIESDRTSAKSSATIRTDTSQRGEAWSWFKKAPIELFEKFVKIRENHLEGQQRLNDLVSNELKTSDLTAADIKLEVDLSTFDLAKSIANDLNAEMQRDGLDLATAARTIAAKYPVRLLDSGAIAVLLDGNSKPNVLAIMKSGPGNRGPPSPAAIFRIGVPSGTPFRTGSARNSRNPVLGVAVYASESAEEYVKSHTRDSIKPVPRPNVDALVKLDGVNEQTAQVVQAAIANHAPAHTLRAIRENLTAAAVRAERAGKNPGPLYALTLKLAFEERRRLTPALAEASSSSSNSMETTIYAPTSYPRAAELPPAVHTHGTELQPNARYVSRVIEEASADVLPAKFVNNGINTKNEAMEAAMQPFELQPLDLPIACCTHAESSSMS